MNLTEPYRHIIFMSDSHGVKSILGGFAMHDLHPAPTFNVDAGSSVSSRKREAI